MSLPIAWPGGLFAVRVLSLLLLLAPGQDSDPSELVRRLGSLDPGERAAAYDRLKAEGEAIRPWLEKAVRESDSEVAARAGTLLRRIDLQKELPREISRPDPEILDQLAQGDGPEWVTLYAQLSRREPRSADLRQWLEKYAAQAFRSAETPDERMMLCDSVPIGVGRKGIPEALKFLRDPSDAVREKVVEFLVNRRAFECEKELTALLEDPLPATREAAVRALGQIFGIDALPLLEPLSQDPSAEVREVVLLIPELFGGRMGAGRIRQIAPFLKDPSEDLRVRAATLLGQSGMPEGIPLLLPCLADPEPEVRAAVATALGRLEAREAGPGLRRLLREDADDSVRQQAAGALGTTGGREAIPELMMCVLDARHEGPLRAAALGALSDLKALEALLAGRALVQDLDPVIRQMAVLLLVALEDEVSAEAIALLLRNNTDNQGDILSGLLTRQSSPWMADSLIALLEDPSWMVRKRALLVLRAWRLERAMPAIVRRLADEHLELRDAAMLGRDWIRTREAEPVLRNLLGHRLAEVRRRAVENALSLLGPGAGEDLVSRIDDLDLTVRLSAIQALGELERPEDLPRFVRLLEDPDRSVRQQAARAIFSQDGYEMIPRIQTLATAGPLEARPGAIRLLLDLGVTETPAEILPLLKSPNVDVQKDGLVAVARLQVKAGAGEVTALLGSPEPSIRAAAVSTLADLGAREALPRIRSLLGDPDPSVRTAALEALTELRDQESIPAVVKLLGHGEESRGACEFLASMGVREAVPALESLLENDPDSFGAALDALGRLGSTASARKVLAHVGDERLWSGDVVGHTLGMLGARDLVPELRKLLRHRYRFIRRQAAAALGDIGAPEAVPDLMALLTDPDDEVVSHAAEALGRMGAREAVPGIRTALRERSWDPEMSWWITCGVGAGPRRGPLLEALIRLNAREAVPDLIRELKTEPIPSNLDVVAALRLLQDPAARPALMEYVSKHLDRSPDPNTRREEWGRIPRFLLYGELDFFNRSPYSTAELVADLGAKEYLPDLVRLLKTGPRSHRLGAARALCQLGSKEGLPLILQESEHGDSRGLLWLNALRRPAVWARLTETRLPKTPALSKKGLWQEVARAMDLRLEMAPDAYERPSEDRYSRMDVRTMEGLYPLVDVAKELLAPTCYQLILEDDRIRIVPETEALQFWKAWSGR